VQVEIVPPAVFPPKRIWYNNTVYEDVYEDGIEIKLLRTIEKELNMKLDIRDITKEENRKVSASIYIGQYGTYSSALDYLTERTHGYLTARFDWYTPCAVKYQRWSRFFNIFSVDMWTTDSNHTCTNPILTVTFSV
jgi:hypothetical protein